MTQIKALLNYDKPQWQLFFSYKRSMAKTITGETKKEIQRKAKRRIAHRNQKKGKR